MIEALESAILAKDPAAVVNALAAWNESEREAARKPLAILLLALGLDETFAVLLDVGLNGTSSEVRAKRQRDGISPMSSRDRTYDYDLHSIAWLACYGLATKERCKQLPSAPDYEAESAQIMTDRRPAWLDEWLDAVTPTDEVDYSTGITASFWARLYQHGLVTRINEAWLKYVFVQQLPEAMEAAREATEHSLRSLEPARSVLYELSRSPHQLTVAKAWTPIVEWMGQEGLLDHKAFLLMLTEALHQPLKSTERNGCAILAKAASSSAAGCTPEIVAELQSHWIGLLSDQQATVAGLGLDQVLAVEKIGALNTAQVVCELPSIFQHKPKAHALKAIKMLARLASQEEVRVEAVQGLCSGLSHPMKEVQAAALEALTRAVGDGRPAIAESLRNHLETVAATLKSQLEQLIDSLSAKGEESIAPPHEKPVSGADRETLRQRAALIQQPIAERFRVGEALQAALEHDWDRCCKWQMKDLRILKIRQPLRPIDSLSELIEQASRAVEHCEGGDIPDQIIDAISRLHAERPEHFDAMTSSLRSRACADVFHRPNRGIVGGILGNAFSDLIAAWLGVELEDEDDDTVIPERYPMGVFLRGLAGRIRSGTAYPLLSTPTHQGGWIDPLVWVRRLHHIEREQIDFFEEDLVRSLLRVAYDSRARAWRLAIDSSEQLSGRFRKLAQFVLDLNEPNENLKLDESWPLKIWMTAIRARDPWVDLTDSIPAEERAQVPAELWNLPDVFQPSNYQWNAIQPKANSRRRGLVECSPMPHSEADKVPPEEELIGQILGEIPMQDNVEELYQSAKVSRSHRVGDAGFYTAKLNYIHSYPAPAYVYPYLATHWPAKLTWYWALATSALSRRVESGASVDERYDQYLLPLLETDRCVERMAARALWIATTSKDPNAKAMATEVWIALIADDRCDADTIVDAWLDVLSGGWMKMNRIAELFAQVAAVSAQHALVVARLLEQFLTACNPLPIDTSKLLELLDDCNERLGRSVSVSVAAVLKKISSGKAKSFAKSLLERQNQVTRQREEAVAAGLHARLSRAERNE